MTLLINATTTEFLVRKLGLNTESDVQKNILYGMAVKIQKDTDDMIEVLKTKRHMQHVDWKELQDRVQMDNIMTRLNKYQKLNVEGDAKVEETLLNNVEHLKILNERFKEAELEM